MKADPRATISARGVPAKRLMATESNKLTEDATSQKNGSETQRRPQCVEATHSPEGAAPTRGWKRLREEAAEASNKTSQQPRWPGVESAKPMRDPIYRIMHRLPRSDVLEVVKCKFGKEHCERAAGYFDDAFMKNPLRRLQLQVGCSGPGGLHLFFPRIFFHRFTLRTLDLSRNKLSADDVATLCDGLALSRSHLSRGSASADTDIATASGGGSSNDVLTGEALSPLELLDLSYNLGIGNRGAVHLLCALQGNTTIRAVLLTSVGIDDEGAAQLAPLLRRRPRPLSSPDGEMTSVVYRQGYAGVNEQRPYTFLLNLNHNVVGAAGTHVLGKGLPSYVSVTLAKQRLKGSSNPRRKWGRMGGPRK